MPRRSSRSPQQDSPLRQARKARNWTLERLVEEIDLRTPGGHSGVTPSMASGWELGRHTTSIGHRATLWPGQPVTMTMHRAKGTEFSKVLLFEVSQGAIPRPLRDEQYAEDAWADALLRERSLLYVAATRARDELALSWSGPPSQLMSDSSATR